MPEAMPWATWGGIKASAAGPGALMTCVTIRGPVRMKMIVSWNEFEKVGAREISFQKRWVRQVVQFLREQGDDDENDDDDDDDGDDDGNDDGGGGGGGCDDDDTVTP